MKEMHWGCSVDIFLGIKNYLFMYEISISLVTPSPPWVENFSWLILSFVCPIRITKINQNIFQEVQQIIVNYYSVSSSPGQVGAYLVPRARAPRQESSGVAAWWNKLH